MAFDFPNAPTVGQIFGSYKWDGEKWGPTTASAGGGAGTVSVVNTSAPISGGPITTTGSIGLNPASVTNAFLAVMPAATFKGNNDGATAAPLDLTVTQVKALLNYTTADITGNLSAAQMPAYTGDVTSPAGSTVNTIAPGAVQTAMIANLAVTAAAIGNAAVTTIKVANNTVSNIKMAQMADQTIKGNVSGSTTNPQDLTGTQVTTILDTFTSTLKGLVPPSGGGTTKFLRADGTWGTVGAGVSISDVPPSSPVPGQIWWESDSGAAFIWFQDANSSQWVALDSSAGLVPVASLISPKMDGAAAIGVDTGWARGDHVHPSDTSRLALTGGALTGGLTGTSISLSGTLTVGGNTAPGAISLNGPAAQTRAINITTAGVMRWAIYTSGDAETGSNAGSTFAINSYADDGSFLKTPLYIRRSDGAVSVNTTLSVTPSAGAALIKLAAPASGQVVLIQSWVGANARWNLIMGNGTAESGSNAGSDFSIDRLSDTGAWLGSPLTILRSNGNITLGGSVLTINPPMTVNGVATFNAQANFNGPIYTGGLVQIGTTLNVGGTSYLNGATTINAALAVAGQATFNANVYSGLSGGGTFRSRGESPNPGGFFVENSAGTQLAGIMYIFSEGSVRFSHYTNNQYLNINSDGTLFHSAAIWASKGYCCKGGISGGAGANVFNLNFVSGASATHLWIDNTDFGVIQTNSDYRIKKDVADLPSMWNRIKALNPISYSIKEYTPAETLRADPDAKPLITGDDTEQWGFIAHELQDTLTPSAATGVKDQENLIQSPNPWTLLASLTKALQEAMARIEALEALNGV